MRFISHKFFCTVSLALTSVTFSSNETLAQRIIKVNNKQELLSAILHVKPGQTIYINDTVEIDLTGEHNLIIPERVTLRSGGEKGGVGGALLYTRKNGTMPLFSLPQPNSRITGLRIQGPDTGIYANGVDHFQGKSEQDKKLNRMTYYKKNMYDVPVSRGVHIKSENAQIDNCDLYGWTHAAVLISKGGIGAKIYNSNIHHNQRFGLGYGICLDEGSAEIYDNIFDYNSHSIAGTGRKGTSFTAYNNIFKVHHIRAWAVDMHGGKDRKDGTNIAGTSINIYNNTFYIKEDPNMVKGIVIRGVPVQGAVIRDNTFYVTRVENKREVLTPASVILQKNAKGKMRIYNNVIKQ